MIEPLILADQRLDMVAPCEAGIEPALVAELTAIGAEEVIAGPRAVTFAGDTKILFRANLWSRLANRVLVAVGKGRVRNRDELYALASTVRWEGVLGPHQTIAVDCRTSNRQLPREEFVNQVVKDAICDRLRGLDGRRPDVSRKEPDVPVHVFLSGDWCTILLDASGERLQRRGYRARMGAAPLRETLAAGMLAIAGYDGRRPFLDPMCGSGTLAIEAAMRARDIAPGLLRLRRDGPGFAFQRWIGHDAREFERHVNGAREAIRGHARFPIVATDHDEGVLAIAKENAELAFVRQDIHFERRELQHTEPAGADTLLVTNPPYGERMGTVLAARDLHLAFGDVLKQRFGGCTAWVLCGDPTLVGAIGLKPSRRVPVFNGPIPCIFARFDLYAGTRRTRVAESGEGQDSEAADAE